MIFPNRAAVQKQKKKMFVHIPSVLQEKIAIFALELAWPRSTPYEGLLLVNRDLSQKFSSFFEFWTLFQKLLARHTSYNDHAQFLAQYRTFFTCKMQPLFRPEVHLLRELYLPHCESCQGPILRFGHSLPKPFRMGLKHMQYLNVDLFRNRSEPLIQDTIYFLLENSPDMHLYVTGTFMDLDIEDFCVGLFVRFQKRVHFGSLLLHVQKNQGGFRIHGMDVKHSVLWDFLSETGERIRDFESEVHHKHDIGDYGLALAQITTLKGKSILHKFHVPQIFYFQIFLHFLKDASFWTRSESERSLIPWRELFQTIRKLSLWKLHTLWILFKGFSQTIFMECQLSHSLEPSLRMFQHLLRHFLSDDHITCYEFFRDHFERHQICDYCDLWLQQKKMLFPKCQQMCVMCIIRRHLTFDNRDEMLLFFKSHGFPDELIYEVFARMIASPVFMARLSDLVWKNLQTNNSENLTQLVRICDLFHIEPLSLLFWKEQDDNSPFVAHMDILSQSSVGCVALFLDQCALSADQIAQCMEDLAEHQLRKMNARFQLQPPSSFNKRESSLRVPQSYPFFPKCLFFPRELIDIIPL